MAREIIPNIRVENMLKLNHTALKPGASKPGELKPGALKEGPEGVKWELGFAWENGISCTGTGIHQQKNNRKWEWD